MFAVIQGFGPFGGLAANPSELLVRALAERADPDLHAEVLPVSAQRAASDVPKLIDRFRPRLYLGVGLAAGRTALAVEAVAVNLADWTEAAADDDGAWITREPVTPGGPAAYLTTLPVTEILAAWQAAGIPGYLSQTAGSYLCNYSFYTAARAAGELGTGCMVGFLHVPLLPDQVTDPERQPSMAMALQAAGLDAVIEACRAAASGGPYRGERGTA